MKHSWQTLLWELWAALCLCTALSFPPGRAWARSPALVWPGLALAAAVPAAWAVWAVQAQLPPPLPPEQRLEPACPFDLGTLCDLGPPAAVP